MTEWEALRQECLHCHACTLAETRTNVVFGVGREDAEIMIIGEAPGANEDKQGEPFVGRGGKPVSYTHLPSPRDKRQSRMPSSA